MTSLRSRNQTRFVVLAPTRSATLGPFCNLEPDRRLHDNLFAEMQRFRGTIYARDGAVPQSLLSPDGRHELPVDRRSWHVLSLDRDHRVCACLRYLDESHAAGFDELWVRHAAITREPGAGRRLRGAVEAGMRAARGMGMGFGEVGGWAVAEHHRFTVEALRIVLATYGLLRLLGDAMGVATATFRHGSAPILRRIGLESLAAEGEELPPYFDPHYGCRMEVLQFDSRRPAARYEAWVQELARDLAAAPVICRERPKAADERAWSGLDLTPEPALAAGW